MYVKSISMEAVRGGWRVTVKYADRWPGPFTFFYADRDAALHHYETEHPTVPGCCEPQPRAEVA